MITDAEIAYFQTFGFLHCKRFLSVHEATELADQFDRTMRKARDGAAEPVLEQDDQGFSRVRQQANADKGKKVPFFDYDPDAFNWMLEDPRFEDYFSHLMGQDYLVGEIGDPAHCAGTEGLIHAGGTPWHLDVRISAGEAEDEFFTMRAHLYLDKLVGPEDGCLLVLPGSHHVGAYRERLLRNRELMKNKDVDFKTAFGAAPEDLPGAFAVVNEPGDVTFLNHRTFHASLTSRTGRRCVHINAGKAVNSHSVPKQVEALKICLTSRYAEVRITAAAALRRLATAEALVALEEYDKNISA